ncbi:glycosyltransferase [Quisquiliibacterium transsilvanicum]|uniref:Glycosyltransferase involved in cell wall biosynthesis n=1 Tax=Quisquiliibacterium transsilvanicum TaxID=1549638 RepID=A0A7W8HK78_9BURK|nr:glycosyltransferase family 1 protein [Quisquiliibacterium transsilvanicum]MBB5273604.1 glycosyltransferase involved in cell wall biosynthesis [Quisquiliibacterium transsilvanicum]
MPPPPDFRPDAAQTQRLLRLHRRALAFRDAQRDADLVAEVNLRYREALAARCLAAPAPGAQAEDSGRILYNVSNLCRRRSPNSIDRVVLALRAELARRPQRLLPVAYDGTSWREARDLATGGDPQAPRMAATGPALAAGPDDRLLNVELDYQLPLEAFAQLARMRRAGLRIATLVHDVFALSYPQWTSYTEVLSFDAWLQRSLAASDRIVCLSQHSARQLRRWVATAPLPAGAPRRRLPVSVIDAGGDGLSAAGPAPQWTGAGDAARFVLPDDDVPTFLAIAAIHPRKGVDTLVAAFSQLWEQGQDLRLVLSGRSIDQNMTAMIRAHPEAGRRLLAPGFLGDEQLRRIAARAQALILPSRDEGFGLPMAEAAALGRPTIARDIPVFREIAGDQPFWFESGRGPRHTLAARLRDWLALDAAQRARHVPAQAFAPWSRSAAQLAAVLTGGPDFIQLEMPSGPPPGRTAPSDGPRAPA